MFYSTATILYKDNWWVVADVDPEICRYYRWWVLKRFGVELWGSRWEPHITIVRGEEPARKDLWEKYHGQTIEFRYDNAMGRDLDSVWWHLNVDCEDMLDIREELGLRRRPEYRLHITVGREHPTEERSRLLWLEEPGGYANSWKRE